MTSSNIGFHDLRGLRVVLHSGRVSDEGLGSDVARHYIGGRGLAAYLLSTERVFEADALGPKNTLVFAPGPLTGSAAPAASRYSVSARSPLTETIFDGNSGGAFGAALRRLGLDYLLVTGVCKEPSYLFIDNKGARLRRAVDLWGLDPQATLGRLRKRHEHCQAAIIGTGGEHLVRFASIVSDHGRQVGRGGLGAVMGSKRLKAVVLCAGQGVLPRPSNTHAFENIVSEMTETLRADPITREALPEFGTSVLVNLLNEAGALPTRNFRESVFEHAEQIGGEAMREGFVEKGVACTGCLVGCKRRTFTTQGGGGSGPEYESLWALGAACGVGDLEAIINANYACNRVGLDTITMGSTIACAMELAEMGLVQDGPRFGDASAIIPLIEATALRQGFRDALAEGSRRLAERYESPELAMHVKGLELPGFDPRGITGQGLAFATSNRGACHTRANMLGPEIVGTPRLTDRLATYGKADLLIDMQNFNAVLDSLVLCKFAAGALDQDQVARLLSAAIGEAVDTADLRRAGERIWNVERLFNLGAGFGRANDTLPPRLLHEPVADGPSKGHIVDLVPMLDEYYDHRDWDVRGVPSKRKLRELELTQLSQGISKVHPNPTAAETITCTTPSQVCLLG